MKSNEMRLVPPYNEVHEVCDDLLGSFMRNARESLGSGVECGLKLISDGENISAVWQTPPGDASVKFTT